MVLYKNFVLLALLIALAKGDYHFERYKIFNFNGDEEPNRKPWFYEDYASPYKQRDVSTLGVGEAYESVAEQNTPEVYENPAEAYFAAGTKKVPNEDKNFKKAISPFYTLTDSDNEKYKSIVLKSGAPYCQEIKSKGPKKRFRRDAMTCYKCKDPKNGATYEQCSYTSEPQESSRVDEYVPLPSTFRYRRSNAVTEKSIPEKAREYRFGQEYFAPAASDEVPAEYKKKTENCNKVVKDSMVCMVCKDPETNGKYEQCSYTNQPTDKAYRYSKSSSIGAPHEEKVEDEASGGAAKLAKNVQQNGNYETPKSSGYADPGSSEQLEASHPALDKYFEEQTSATKKRAPKHKAFERSEENEKLESGSENVKDGSCKKVVKDSMVCTVCTDPKTGGSYEQCSYAYNPNDKVYQFSRQKTFGYPEDGAEGKSRVEDEAKAASSHADDGGDKSDAYRGFQDSDDYYEPQKYSGSPSYHGDSSKYFEQPTEKQESHEYVPYKLAGEGPSVEHVKSESERISEEAKDGKDCVKVQKDTMTCMVCKDPKTGGNSEQCSYAYQPNDKIFSYTRAKSYGSPEAEEKGSYAENPEGNPFTGYAGHGSYGLASDHKPYVASGEAKPGLLETPGNLAVDFFSTAEKKKEIEKVLNEFGKKDRSKCQKVIRDKLTCFQCKDKDGMQKEECIFVAEQEPSKDRLAYREVKEFQQEPAFADASAKIPEKKRAAEEKLKSASPPKKQKRKTKKITHLKSYPEPTISASEYQEKRSEREPEEESRVGLNEDVIDGESYDFAAETAPTYDKILGLTLPRYMLTTSEHEAEFDEVVASDRI